MRASAASRGLNQPAEGTIGLAGSRRRHDLDRGRPPGRPEHRGAQSSVGDRGRLALRDHAFDIRGGAVHATGKRLTLIDTFRSGPGVVMRMSHFAQETTASNRGPYYLVVMPAAHDSR